MITESISLAAVATTPKKVSPVCLVSSHPLFLDEVKRKLEQGYPAQTQQLQVTTALDEQANNLPKAQVYVVDALSQKQLAAMFISAFTRRFPDGRVLVVGDEFEEHEAFDMLELGVKGILRYADTDLQLLRAVESIANGGYWVPRAVLSGFVEQILKRQRNRQGVVSGTTGVSPREEQILDGLLDNLSNKEIANKLNISERTVKFHVSNLLAKYRVQRRADLILLSFHAQRGGERFGGRAALR